MGIGSKTVKKATKKARTWLRDRIGSQLITRMADTSADAPSSFTKPKRDLYNKMKAAEAEAAAAAKAAAESDDEQSA
jgi:hypothetical protein